MNKEIIRQNALQLFNDCIKSKIYVSYLSVLKTMYETATKQKKYEKAHIINELISEEIN